MSFVPLFPAASGSPRDPPFPLRVQGGAGQSAGALDRRAVSISAPYEVSLSCSEARGSEGNRVGSNMAFSSENKVCAMYMQLLEFLARSHCERC